MVPSLRHFNHLELEEKVYICVNLMLAVSISVCTSMLLGVAIHLLVVPVEIVVDEVVRIAAALRVQFP
jgi:hypothetical protein